MFRFFVFLVLLLLEKRLRRRAAVLVQQERESLLHELHAELELERKRFEARKPGLSEEVSDEN